MYSTLDSDESVEPAECSPNRRGGDGEDVALVSTPLLAGSGYGTLCSVIKPLMTMAWPVSLASLSSTLLPTVSLLFVGQLSSDALSAGGLASMFVNIAGVSH